MISRYAWNLDYEKREYHCNCPLFTFKSTSQGVKYRLFSSKNCLTAVNLTIANLYLEVPKNWHSTKVECLDILNATNIKVAGFAK